MHFKISIYLFISIILFSCSLEINKKKVKTLLEKKDEVTEATTEVIIEATEDIKEKPKKIIKEETVKKTDNVYKESQKKIPIYIIGEPFLIDGVKYIPKENYNYDETGLASFYGPNLHRTKTVNNEYNMVTELFARHKTLPLPSVVKITNLENGLSIIVRVNDRGPLDNTRVIEVSRKVAQLLRFYKQKITKVRVEILSDSSKQLKIVTQSMSNPDFNNTLNAVPIEGVIITDMEESIEEETTLNTSYEQPIQLGLEEISKSDLFVKITGFNTYKEAQNINNIIKGIHKITTQKENEGYSILFGPMLIQEADNLLQILLSKGYKQSKIIIN